MSGSLTDIHEQQTTEGRLDLATRAANIGLWDWDIPTGQTYFNDIFYTMLGYESGELPMCVDTWKELIHPDDLEPTLADLRNHLEGSSPRYDNVHRLRTKFGSWQWIHDIGEIVERDENGSPKGMIGLHVDITATKNAQEAIAEITSAPIC